MLKYLVDTFGERAQLGDKQQLEFLRGEVTRLTELVVSTHKPKLIGRS